MPTFVSFLAKPNAFAARSRASWNRFLKLRNATCTDCLKDKRTLRVQCLPVLLAHMLHGIWQLFPEPTLCHLYRLRDRGASKSTKLEYVLFFEQCLPFVACTHALWNNLHSDTCTVRLPEKNETSRDTMFAFLPCIMAQVLEAVWCHSYKQPERCKSLT